MITRAIIRLCMILMRLKLTTLQGYGLGKPLLNHLLSSYMQALQKVLNLAIFYEIERSISHPESLLWAKRNL